MNMNLNMNMNILYTLAIGHTVPIAMGSHLLGHCMHLMQCCKDIKVVCPCPACFNNSF